MYRSYDESTPVVGGLLADVPLKSIGRETNDGCLFIFSRRIRPGLASGGPVRPVTTDIFARR